MHFKQVNKLHLYHHTIFDKQPLISCNFEMEFFYLLENHISDIQDHHVLPPEPLQPLGSEST